MSRERQDCGEGLIGGPGKGLVWRLLRVPRALVFCKREKAETENRE